MGVRWVAGSPPGQRRKWIPNVCGWGERGAGTGHSPTPAPPVPQPLGWGRGWVLGAPRAPSAGVLRGDEWVGAGGTSPPRFSPPAGGAVWARGGAGGRAEPGGLGGLGRSRGRAAGSMTGLCLSCLLWVRPAAPAPGNTEGHRGRSRTAARWGLAAGSGSGAGPGSGRWRGLVAAGSGTERRRLRRDGRTGSEGNGRHWTGTGSGGTVMERRLVGMARHRERVREEPRVPGGAERDPVRENVGGGHRAGGARSGCGVGGVERGFPTTPSLRHRPGTPTVPRA